MTITTTKPVENEHLISEQWNHLYPCDNEHCVWGAHVEPSIDGVRHQARHDKFEFGLIDINLEGDRWFVDCEVTEDDGHKVTSEKLLEFADLVAAAEKQARILNGDETQHFLDTGNSLASEPWARCSCGAVLTAADDLRLDNACLDHGMETDPVTGDYLTGRN